MYSLSPVDRTHGVIKGQQRDTFLLLNHLFFRLGYNGPQLHQ
jgi:hypothetical protein